MTYTPEAHKISGGAMAGNDVLKAKVEMLDWIVLTLNAGINEQGKKQLEDKLTELKEELAQREAALLPVPPHVPLTVPQMRNKLVTLKAKELRAPGVDRELQDMELTAIILDAESLVNLTPNEKYGLENARALRDGKDFLNALGAVAQALIHR